MLNNVIVDVPAPSPLRKRIKIKRKPKFSSSSTETLANNAKLLENMLKMVEEEVVSIETDSHSDTPRQSKLRIRYVG